MELFKIIGIGIVTTISVLIVKQTKPEIAMLLGISGSLLILLMIANSLTSVLGVFQNLIDRTNLNNGLFSAVLKIIGIGYLTEFSANLCYDAGSTGVSNKILLAGKILILMVAMPIVTNLVELIIEILP